MVLDALSPVVPARVRCLLVPTGRITRNRFLEFVRRLQNESVVRLGDVSPDSQPGTESFSPLAFPSGVVVYDLTISDPTPGQRALYPFELAREPFVILGLADAREYGIQSPDESSGGTGVERGDQVPEDLISDLTQAVEDLPGAYNVALVHQVFLFDHDRKLSININGVIQVPATQKSHATALKTKMCDITSLLLSGMASLAKSIQALATIETPRQAMPDGYVRPTNDTDQESKRLSWLPGSSIRTPSPNFSLSRLSNRASLPAHLFGASSGASSPSEEHPHSETTSPTSDNAATTFDQMHLQAAERRHAGLDGANDRISVQSFGSDPASERGRTQGRGRISIILGSLHLMAGRWPDAVKELVHGGLAARSTNDHIWHAKAVDLILVTLLLCAWAGIEFEVPPLCLPIAERSSMLLGKSSKKTEDMANEVFVHHVASKQEDHNENLKTLANVIPEIVQHIVRLYTRTTAEPVAQLVLSDAFIRLSKLSTVILLCPDLSDKSVMENLVLNKALKLPIASEGIVSLQTPAKAEIAALALASIPSAGIQDMLQCPDRLAIHAGVAVILGMLGYHRKKAFVLRELLTFLLPALENGGLDVHLGAALSSSQTDGGVPATSQLNGHTADPTEDHPGTMYEFLLQVCHIYGAVVIPASDDLGKKPTSRFATGDAAGAEDSVVDEAALLAARIENDAITRRFGSWRLKMDVLFACITVCEIIPDLHGAVSFSSSLLRTASSGIAPGPQTLDGGPILGRDNQARLTEAMRHAAEAATDMGVGQIEAEYWDDFLVRDIEVLPTSNALEVTKRKRSELAAVKQSLAQKTEGPFIVNKFTQRASASKREQIVVAGEKFCFSILLQNLYDVPLDIDSLELDVSGAKVESKMEGFSIGAYQTQRLRVIAEASSAGSMKVHGCLIQVRTCSLRKYPIFKDKWRPKEDVRVKQQGLALLAGTKARPNSTASEVLKSGSSSKPVASTIQATVIEPQPRLEISKTSLVQNNIMVLEGEKRRFSITIKNTSIKVVDFVALTFDDSTLPILQAAVQDRELPAADLYEVEYGIYRKSALHWPKSTNTVRLDAGQELDVEVEVLGKVGLSSGVVHFDYASLGPSTSEGGDDIYVRRVSTSFTVTVNPSIDLIRNDVLSLTGPLAQMRPKPLASETAKVRSGAALSNNEWMEDMLEPVRHRLLLKDDGIDHCLFLLDFYNSWTSTLIVMPQIRRSFGGSDDDWQDVLQLSEPIDPGQSTRFLLPVPRLNLKDPYAPIPSLNPASKRQFVISTGKVNEGYERSSRDAFWHREELLKHIRVTWLDPATKRTGSVELRAIRLTVRMLDALKLEGLMVELSPSGSEGVTQLGQDRFSVPADEFVTITTKLTNRSPQPIYPLLRLQPSVRNQPYNVALDMSKKFAFTGLLQQPLPLLDAGASTEVQLSAVFLCSGEFEMSASVEELRIWKPAGAESQKRDRAGSRVDLDVLSSDRKDRRIWFAKEPCRIDVHDV